MKKIHPAEGFKVTADKALQCRLFTAINLTFFRKACAFLQHILNQKMEFWQSVFTLFATPPQTELNNECNSYMKELNHYHASSLTMGSGAVLQKGGSHPEQLRTRAK